ncbi:MAG: tetratricopeptide repeat protein [Gemmatimonadota bacterium]|nr:tetratricopeptide repeat protein [Gemmatimonadota bacterium]
MRSCARIAIGSLLFLIVQSPALPGQELAPLEFHRTLTTADSLYEVGDRASAIPSYERVVAHDPLHAEAWFRLGRAYGAAERWADAARALERAHALGYRDRWWIAQRIAAHRLRLGHAERALDWLEVSLEERHENRPSLVSDPDFAALSGEPRFERMVASAPDSLDRVTGWRHDLRYLVEEARRLHAGPLRPAHSERFGALADSIHDRIPELDDAEVILELHRLVNLLDDGHTGIYAFVPNRLGIEFPTLPVLFHRFEGGFYVVDGKDAGERLIGSRVLRIGPLEPEEALRRMGTWINKDNAVTPAWLGVRFYLPSVRYLAAVGATTDLDRVTLELESPDGAIREVALPTGEYTFPRKLRHPDTATASPPLWLREVDTNYRLVPRPDLDAIYFPFNQIRDAEEGPTLAAFADTLRAALERTGASELIVDLRHNNGGNYGLLGPLQRTLVWWDEEDPGHRLWIVTGRNTFSAAQVFITRLERWTDAIFVGERSSSRPNFTGEETSVRLPWSGVRGSISSRHNQVSDAMDDRAWIDVDLPVPVTAEDYFAGRDPVLETLERAIGASGE